VSRTPEPLPAATSGLHIPALDGVRGLAILMVLAAHAAAYGGFRPASRMDHAFSILGSAGGLGVDLFFVLSGFLITGILLDSRDGNRYFFNFYSRRVLRIFPLYYGFLFVVLIVLPRVFPDNVDLQEILDDRAWYWTYTINIRTALGGWPENTMLGHFWSLAVEEQFYLLWPLVIWLTPRRRVPLAVGLFFATSVAMRAGMQLAGLPPTANVLTPARLDALAVGAGLAWLAREPGGLARMARWAWPALGATGIPLVLLLAWTRGWNPRNVLTPTVARTLVSLAFGALLMAAVTAPAGGRMARFFSSRLMVFFGVYSYGIYVFHHPLLHLLRDRGVSVDMVPGLSGSRLPGLVVVFLITCAVSVLVALVSYHLWEQPFLRLKRFFAYQPSGRQLGAAAGEKGP
jgi:peptidoglycan/LPS O-acetylase OafA/YrhL